MKPLESILRQHILRSPYGAYSSILNVFAAINACVIGNHDGNAPHGGLNAGHLRANKANRHEEADSQRGAQQLKGIMHGDTEGQRKPHIAQNACQRAVQRL